MKFTLRDLLLVTMIVVLAVDSPRIGFGQDEPPKNPTIKVEMPADALEPDAGLVEYLATHSQDKICQALLKQLRMKPDKSKDRFNGFTCKLVSPYKLTRSEVRYVFVYDSNTRGWPGVQPQTIVITDQ